MDEVKNKKMPKRFYMICEKKDLVDCLAKERNLYGFSNSMKYFLYCLLSHEKAILWKFQKRLRITEFHKNNNNRIRFAINWWIFNRMRIKYGLHLGLNVFGVGLKIMHLGPILVNEKVKVGKNCSIHSNTALVARGTDDSVPVLGDDIVIGFGSCVLGGVNIANGIAIGAHALVNKSFDEEGIAIAGVPAKKISQNGKRKWGEKKT